jgi:putative transposase
LGIKKEHPSWGAPKIRDRLIREYPMIPPPAVSTIHVRSTAKATQAPESLWDATVRRPRAQWPLVRRLQGEFMLGNRQYCYPLTISNYRSRYLLACEGLDFAVFERTFKDFGLPAAIRTDNGVPFAAPGAMSACPGLPSGGCAWACASSASSSVSRSKRPS